MIEAREKWVHEDDLINHRLSWLGVTQGLLFAALGFALHEQSALSNDAGPPMSPLLKLLVNYLPYLGLLTSTLIFIGVLGATIAMIRIKRIYGLDQYGISLLTTAMGWTCALGLPVSFVIAWVLVLLNTGA